MGRADIKLGYSCNNDCIHCVIADHRDLVLARGLPEDIPEEEYRRELKDSRARADSVVFTGGEPTIRKELMDLLAYARDLGYEIMMQTNGRRLSRMNFARALCGIAPIKFTIALHGHTPQIHDAITRAEGSFYETVQGIRNLIEINGSSDIIGGKIVISKINAPYITDTTRFMLNLGISSINITFPHACGNARKDFFNVVPRYSEIKHQVNDSIHLCREMGAGVSTEAIPFCLLPGAEFCSSELQYKYHGYSELKQYGCDETIDWQKMRPEIKKKGPDCPKCRFDKVCEGPWMEYPSAYGFEELVPVRGIPVCCPSQVLEQQHLQKQFVSRPFAFAIDNCI